MKYRKIMMATWNMVCIDKTIFVAGFGSGVDALCTLINVVEIRINWGAAGPADPGGPISTCGYAGSARVRFVTHV